MLLSLAVAATVLASPPPAEVASLLAKGAVFLVIGQVETSAARPFNPPSGAAETKEGAFLGGVLTQLAVVRPHRSAAGAPPSLQMVVLVTPMRDRLGFCAFGTF